MFASACSSRSDAETRVEFFETKGHVFSTLDRYTIEGIAGATVDEVRPLLPGLPRRIVIRVQSADAYEVSDMTGEDATAAPPDTVMWTVNTKHRAGASAVARAELRATLFHALHCLVRGTALPPKTVLDRAVTQGMATAFARDHASAAAPWGWYPADVASWVDELKRLPADTKPGPWMSHHPDGRRWIAIKAGTYLVDRAVRASGRSSAALVTTPTGEVVVLAGDS